MNEGISIDEACANNTIGTRDDFERLCNADGTAKSQPKTTTFTTRDDNTALITIENAHLHIAAVGLLLVIVLIAIILVRKLKRS